MDYFPWISRTREMYFVLLIFLTNRDRKVVKDQMAVMVQQGVKVPLEVLDQLVNQVLRETPDLLDQWEKVGQEVVMGKLENLVNVEAMVE